MNDELSDECTRLAAGLLFGSGGLSSWPWYRSALPRMRGEIGADVMMHEARQELMRLRMLGVPALEAFRQTEAWLRGLWRPTFDRDWSTSYRPETLPLLDEVVGAPSVSSSEGAGAPHEWVLTIREAVSVDQWEMLVAYAEHGTLREAASHVGVHYSTVQRAVKAAREAVCNKHRV